MGGVLVESARPPFFFQVLNATRNNLTTLEHIRNLDGLLILKVSHNKLGSDALQALTGKGLRKPP